MKYREYNSRKIYLGSYQELKLDTLGVARYALLIDAPDRANFPLTKEEIEPLITTNCVEVYCVGPGGERLHDLIDEIVEDLGFSEIVTTWASEETVDDSCFYFLNIAGSGAPILLVLSSDTGDLEGVMLQTISSGQVEA